MVVTLKNLESIAARARKGRVVQEDDGYEEAMREHTIFGIWLDKEGKPKADQPDARNARTGWVMVMAP